MSSVLQIPATDVQFTTLGDLVYGAASGYGTVLTGNITAVKQYLSQTGTGAVSAAPAWASLAYADLPTIANNTVLGNSSGGAAVPSALTGANVRTICGLATTDTPQFLRLGLGTSAHATLYSFATDNVTAPPAPIDIYGTYYCAKDGEEPGSFVDAFGSSWHLRGRRANGTNASRTALLSGDIMLSFAGHGYDGTNYTTASRGRFQLAANENWTTTAHGTRMDLVITPNGTIIPATTVSVDGTGLWVYATTAATSPTTGSTIISGGLGVAGAAWIGGLANIAGTLTAQGNITAASLTVDSPTLFVDSANHRVGVGTVSPLSLLHVEGSTPDIRLVNAANRTWKVQASGANYLNFMGETTTLLQIQYSTQIVAVTGGFTTGAPIGGTAATWKMGIYVTTAPAATGYVQLDIGGTLYKLLAST